MDVELTEDILKTFKQFFEGYVRTVAKLKQDGIMSIIEGKQAMSFRGNKYLAMKALGQSTDRNLAIFSHLYLLLCWNLIARGVSVGGLMYNHVSWENDSMIIVFPSHKLYILSAIICHSLVSMCSILVDVIDLQIPHECLIIF